jgi:NADP-dependent 3-hydroxy acid dehydrogenase YdfG
LLYVLNHICEVGMTSTSFSPKTILITGATAGIGLAAACDIAASGGLIIGVGRSPNVVRLPLRKFKNTRAAGRVAFSAG